MPATRNVKYGPYNPPQGMSFPSNGGVRITDGLTSRTSGTGRYDLLSHVPNTLLYSGPNQPFVLPASAPDIVSTSASAFPSAADSAIALATSNNTSRMRAAQTATPAGTPRIGVRARSAANSPYNRVNSTTTTKVNADLDEIIKNCPAVDVLLGGYATPRSSTHNRTRDQEHVSRPPNAFMVYRSYVWFTKQLHDNDEKNLSCVSKLAADSWKDMNDQARAPFHSVASLAKRKHAELYPDYKYAPTSRTDKPTKKKAQPALKARETANLKEKADVAASIKKSPLLSPTPKQKQKQVVKTGVGTPSKSLPVAIGPAPPTPATSNRAIALSPRLNQATAGSSNSPPVIAAPAPPVDTCVDEHPVLSPLPIKGTWTAAWTTQALFYGEPPSSPVPSNWSSSSSTSSTPLSTPEIRPVSLGYDFWDRHYCGYPAKPPFRALRVPSPAISELELGASCWVDPWPDKYAVAQSFNDLQPSALLFYEEKKDGFDPDTEMFPPPQREDIDYSRFISGNPNAELLSPTLAASYTDTGTLAAPCTKTVHGDFDWSPSSTFDVKMLNMLTLGPGPIVDQTGMYELNDAAENLDPVVLLGFTERG